MLPRSSEAGSGAIGWLQWLKITWNYFWTPRFNPLTVIRLFLICYTVQLVSPLQLVSQRMLPTL